MEKTQEATDDLGQLDHPWPAMCFFFQFWQGTPKQWLCTKLKQVKKEPAYSFFCCWALQIQSSNLRRIENS